MREHERKKKPDGKELAEGVEDYLEATDKCGDPYCDVCGHLPPDERPRTKETEYLHMGKAP